MSQFFLFQSILCEESSSGGNYILLISAVLSAFIGAIVTVVINAFTAKRDEKKFYSQTVSAERIHWIGEIREWTLALIVFCEKYRNESTLDEEKKAEFEKVRSAILLRITPLDVIKEFNEYVPQEKKCCLLKKRSQSKEKKIVKHYELDEMLQRYLAVEEKDLNKAFLSVKDNLSLIRDTVTKICKGEWSRIKAEAGGNKNIEKKIAKHDKSIKENYSKG